MVADFIVYIIGTVFQDEKGCSNWSAYQTFQLSRFDCETPGMRHLCPPGFTSNCHGELTPYSLGLWALGKTRPKREAQPKLEGLGPAAISGLTGRLPAYTRAQHYIPFQVGSKTVVWEQDYVRHFNG